jgi:DNA polymerase-3 subunit beta
MDANNYPDFPEYDTTNGIQMYSKNMISMIDQTVFATSGSEDKPVLTGILVEIESEKTRMVALDGYRLAVREENIKSSIEHKEVIVPAKSMREAARILPQDETIVKLYFGERMMSIVCADTQISTRVLQGDYIKYKNIIPANFETRFIVNRMELYNSLDIASILARQTKTNVVNLNIDGETLTITSNSEVGTAREELNINLTGKNLDISFNSRYLLDVLKEVDDDEIVFDLNTPISPCVIRPVSGSSYLYMVLPVKTNNSI